MGTDIDNKRRRKGKNRGKKRKKKSPKRCPAKKTPQCSVLHEWHDKHVKYHQVVVNELLKQVNERPCRCAKIYYLELSLKENSRNYSRLFLQELFKLDVYSGICHCFARNLQLLQAY